MNASVPKHIVNTFKLPDGSTFKLKTTARHITSRLSRLFKTNVIILDDGMIIDDERAISSSSAINVVSLDNSVTLNLTKHVLDGIDMINKPMMSDAVELSTVTVADARLVMKSITPGHLRDFITHTIAPYMLRSRVNDNMKLHVTANVKLIIENEAKKIRDIQKSIKPSPPGIESDASDDIEVDTDDDIGESMHSMVNVHRERDVEILAQMTAQSSEYCRNLLESFDYNISAAVDSHFSSLDDSP